METKYQRSEIPNRTNVLSKTTGQHVGWVSKTTSGWIATYIIPGFKNIEMGYTFPTRTDAALEIALQADPHFPEAA